MNIILIRHAQSEWNKKKIIQGRLDSAITEYGYRQIDALISALSNEKIAHIYSSTSNRAISTAEYLAKFFDVPISTDSLLLEQDFGIIQGLTHLDAENRFLQHFLALKSGDINYQYSNGESAKQSAKRLLLFLNKLIIKDETIFIISHNHTISAFIGYLLNEDISLSRYNHEGCSFSRLNLDAERKIILKRWGISTHLLRI